MFEELLMVRRAHRIIFIHSVRILGHQWEGCEGYVIAVYGVKLEARTIEGNTFSFLGILGQTQKRWYLFEVLRRGTKRSCSFLGRI